MKNFKLPRKLMMGAMVACALSVSITSCKDDDDEEEDIIDLVDEGTVVVSSNITTNTTWTHDKVYQLASRVTVVNGVTLTIEAGTVIKGEAGTGANSTALLIARGAKLMANGTASSPIIFTSVADEIVSGQIASPNLDPDLNGLWGGVIILGKAPIFASASELQVEGIPTSDPNGLYGGNLANDNSGTIRYISIRHGGSLIGSGNEINGLTLGGVGSETTIDHVEVVANQDDGIEWFGGTVSLSDVLIWNAGDDGLDTDQGWSGTVDNFVIVTPSGHAFELDGPEDNSTNAARKHTFMNGTVVASDTARGFVSQDLINVDANSEVTLNNIHFTQIAGNANFDNQMINRTTAALVDFVNITLNVPANEVANHVNGAVVPPGITSGTTGKADISQFSWTWATADGKTSGL